MSFYKKIGSFCNLKKNVLFILGTCFFLISSISIYMSFQFFKLKDGLNRLKIAEYKALNSIDSRKKIKNFITQKTAFDKFFIDNNLENLTFLEKEKQILSKIILHPAFANSSEIKKRIDFIEKGKNRLHFAEENIKKTLLIKEIDELQLHPIEIDETDLQKLLSIIEGIYINSFSPLKDSPQLIIKNFSLSKNRENIFSLNMKLLKREYLPKMEKHA